MIGYNYLGGHLDTPWPRFREYSGWRSPQKTTEDSSLVLLTDLNDWSPGYGKTFAPHAANGPILADSDASNSDRRWRFQPGHRSQGRKRGNLGRISAMGAYQSNEALSGISLMGQRWLLCGVVVGPFSSRPH